MARTRSSGKRPGAPRTARRARKAGVIDAKAVEADDRAGDAGADADGEGDATADGAEDPDRGDDDDALVAEVVGEGDEEIDARAVDAELARLAGDGDGDGD